MSAFSRHVLAATTLAASVAALALLLAACDDPAASYRARVQATLASMMRDPASVRFKDVRQLTYAGLPTLCGYVDGKNGFGAYPGYSRFLAQGENVSIEPREQTYVRVMIAGQAPRNYGAWLDDAALERACYD
jgi:hypothetical protein